MKHSNFKLIFIVALCSAFFLSCTTLPKEIPEELTAQEIIQKGQTEFENGHYKAALFYYNTVTERYQDSPPVYIEACYEIGHIYMKMKKYDKAETVFQQILDTYSSTQPGSLPGAYQKLAQLEMNKIQEKKK